MLILKSKTQSSGFSLEESVREDSQNQPIKNRKRKLQEYPSGLTKANAEFLKAIGLKVRK